MAAGHVLAVRKGRERNADAQLDSLPQPSLSLIFIPYGTPALGIVLPTLMMGQPSLISYPFLQHPEQTHPEMCVQSDCEFSCVGHVH